jgi:hypothetical protein
MTLTRRRVSPKVRSMKLECRIRLWCSTGNRRVAGELLAVGQQALHRGGVGPLVLLGEGVDAALHGGDEFVAGCAARGEQVVDVEDRPVGVAHLGLDFGGQLGQVVAAGSVAAGCAAKTTRRR